MEEEENNKIAVLDLELNVNRISKKVEFNVHYKKTNTFITIKKKSNHSENIKKGVIKGYTERAKTYCDPKYLKKELNNIMNMFQDNGYNKKEIEDAMNQENNTPEEEENEIRGIVTIPNIPGFMPKFKKIVKQHKFRVANKTENKVRDLIGKARTPLGDKNTNVVYNIPCNCKKYSYTGETNRKWETRKKEHQNKVRLTKQDLEAGNTEKAQKRMNEGDGGLAKHATLCTHGINWEDSKIINREERWTQRKYLEGIETLRQKQKGIIPLNSYNQLEQWKSVLHNFFQG